jgi:hypothetical protein
MTNFDKQLTQAIATYSELSGKTKEQIIAKCKDDTSYEYKHVTMIMFAAR